MSGSNVVLMCPKCGSVSNDEHWTRCDGSCPRSDSPHYSETEAIFWRVTTDASVRATMVEHIARTAHEVNRAYCQSMGDDTQVPWEEAPEWQRQSALNGVRFHLDNPDMTPEQSHENWLREKEATGWTYGPEKDVENKKHPCMKPYGELPADQKAKDHMFRAVVHTLG